MISVHWTVFMIFGVCCFTAGIGLSSLLVAAGQADELAEEVRDDEDQ